MFKFFSREINIRTGRNYLNAAKRFFLSEAYRCSDAWEDRLKDPAFKKIDFENVYYNLDLDFQAKNRINVLDIDLFATSLTDCKYKSEIEDLLVKVRECPECILLPERTLHAVVRFYMDKAPKEDLFNILGNRLLYGVFPNNYLCNILMDKFLKENDTVSAVKIAVLQMLQEDTQHPITKVLALHSCYKYLSSSQVWSTPKDPEESTGEDEDEEEVTKVRVNYLRNPYFDDHFDIRNVNHLIGKTLWLFGLSVDDVLGKSSILIGLILHEKYEKTVTFLEDAISNKMILYSDAVRMGLDILTNPQKENTQSEKSTEEEAENQNAQKGAKPQNPVSSDSDKGEVDALKSKVKALLEKLDKTNQVSSTLLDESEKAVKKAVDLNQENDIATQSKLYKQWEKERKEHIQSEIERSEMLKVQDEINKIKQELEEEEQRLFYFDEEEGHELKISETQKRKDSVVYYKEKRAKLAQKEDVYNPPDVHQKRNEQH